MVSNVFIVARGSDIDGVETFTVLPEAEIPLIDWARALTSARIVQYLPRTG